MSDTESNTSRPDSFPLSVITAREPVANNPWITERWRVLGVVGGHSAGASNDGRSVIYSGADGTRYLWPGFEIRLRKHETESYYLNLLGQEPSVYVVCHVDDGGELVPVETTVEYVEAGARREAGDEVCPVRMPPEVYRWVEAYVIEHYTPEEPKMKRKHAHWGKGEGGRRSEPND